MWNLLVEGLTQPLPISSSLRSSLGLLFALSLGPLPQLGENTIALYLVLQIVWTLLLWLRATRAVGLQSARRELEKTAKEAWLKCADVGRFFAAGLVCNHLLAFEVGGQLCQLYCGAVALRAVVQPFFYGVLSLVSGPELAQKLTGYDPTTLLEAIGWQSRAELRGGPAWKQHGQASAAHRKKTSAQSRKSSLAPVHDTGGEKNNNDRCTVLDEGPHFNRTARGCLLAVGE